MTPREKEILELIKINPQISQEEIGKRLHITRSSVAVHINHLMNKGYILGRGYLLKNDPYIAILGGASVDLRGIPEDKLLLEESNPGQFLKAPGGVGRNIGHNLGLLGYPTTMITLLANDRLGQWLMEKGEEVRLSFQHSFIVEGGQTPTYLEILDESGEMVAAISDMKLLDDFRPEYVEKKREVLEHAELVIVDTNLPKETLEYLFHHIHAHFLVDGVSATKVLKLNHLLPKIHTLKCNQHEAEALVGKTFESEEDMKEGLTHLVQKGLTQVVVTCGKKGAYGYDGKTIIHRKAEEVQAKNATGAGDAFTAGFAYGMVKGWDLGQCLGFATGTSLVALESEEANPKTLTEEEVMKKAGGIDDVRF